MFWLSILLAGMTTTTSPEPIRPGKWIGPYDYPPQALRQNEQGYTGFRLTITPLGEPERCDVWYSSGFKDLDDETCRLLMKRARFHPARDEDGNPISSVFKSYNAWLIPEAGNMRPPSMIDLDLTVNRLPKGLSDPVEVKVNLLTDEKGHLEKCEAEDSKAAQSLGKLACEHALANWIATPALSKDGARIRSVQTARISFSTAKKQ